MQGEISEQTRETLKTATAIVSKAVQETYPTPADIATAARETLGVEIGALIPNYESLPVESVIWHCLYELATFNGAIGLIRAGIERQS